LVYATGAVAVLHYWWLVRSDVRRPVAYASVVLVLLALRAQKLRVNHVKRAAVTFSLSFAAAGAAHAAPAGPHASDVAVGHSLLKSTVTPTRSSVPSLLNGAAHENPRHLGSFTFTSFR